MSLLFTAGSPVPGASGRLEALDCLPDCSLCLQGHRNRQGPLSPPDSAPSGASSIPSALSPASMLPADKVQPLTPAHPIQEGPGDQRERTGSGEAWQAHPKGHSYLH